MFHRPKFHRRWRKPLLCVAMALTAVLAAAPALPATAGNDPARQASIPFAASNGIRDWQADGTQGLWVRANSGAWYYGRFSFPCAGLQFKTALQFKFSPSGAFDRWSEVLTREQGRCLFKTVETSTGPPKPEKPKSPAQADAPAASPAPAGPGSPAAPAPGN